MSRSQELFAAAKQYLPGGVNSPVRAFKSVGGDPVFFKRGAGAYLYDEDDQCYIDYVGSWGPMICGHAHPDIIRSVQETAANGLSFGAPTALETELARKVCELVPSVELIRMCNSGTEAAMSAIRLARGYTGRNKIIKFEGCYHGHSDALLVKAGSGALTLGVPTSPGVPAETVVHTITLTFNDIDNVKDAFEKWGDDIACVMVEPIAGNMNCIPAVAGFLEGLRSICDDYGSLLIFDEVMTGFRVALGGAQARYNVQPHMTAFGKVIGGGMPVGAFGGKREVMEHLSPLGPIYQAGTLSGNPVAMAAGLKTLELISVPGFFEALEAKSERLTSGMKERAQAAGIPLSTHRAGGMFGIFFSEDDPITSYQQATNCDTERFKRFFHGMLAAGVYLAPSAYEAGFISIAHTDQDIDQTVDIAATVFKNL